MFQFSSTSLFSNLCFCFLWFVVAPFKCSYWFSYFSILWFSPLVSWLVVWNMFFSIQLGIYNHPNWPTHMFQRGRLNHQADIQDRVFPKSIRIHQNPPKIHQHPPKSIKIHQNPPKPIQNPSKIHQNPPKSIQNPSKQNPSKSTKIHQTIYQHSPPRWDIHHLLASSKRPRHTALGCAPFGGEYGRR